ncbi:MAG: N-acetylglucosamine-6-phosphate deacetylase [Clostridia bacterium]|nr:N-acetylglucosamine-6-phosphate deacetylase [Clostridia bacterium]
MMKSFKNVLSYVEGQGIVRTDLSFGERIERIGQGTSCGDVIELPEDAIVLPGFIDGHIHGAGGADTMDGSVESLACIAKTVAEEGTTSFLATTMTQSPEAIKAALHAVKIYREGKQEGARLLGVHLEGPFISPEHKGAQPLSYVQSPDVGVFDEYNAASGNCIRTVTLAPEREGARELIAHLVRLGILPSIGHTGATYADIEGAVRLGARCVTHTYNAQSALHHREIGTVGSALLLDDLACELIADTVHVSPPAMRLLVKCKPHGKLILVTDAMRAKGLCDGESELGGQRVTVKNGQARLADGTLAGSVLRMNEAIRNMVEVLGLSLTEACDLATANPAALLGIDRETGSIREGKRADFAVLDSRFAVICTVCGGEIVYQRENR